MALIPPRGDSGFTIAGFLILAALGTFIWQGAPLESGRPTSETKDSTIADYTEKIPARLWQDPFRAVRVHQQSLVSENIRPSQQQHLKQVIENLINQSPLTQTPQLEIHALLVFLSPGIYPELEERRRRRRYAVLSGLNEASYVPQEAESVRVSYFPRNVPQARTTQDVTCNADSYAILNKKCFAVPYEWYAFESTKDHSSRSKYVLVLWLDESQFAHAPLASMKSLLEQSIVPGNTQHDWRQIARIQVTALGPARSDALRKLLTESKIETIQWIREQSGLTEFNIYSPTATVDDQDLGPGISKFNTTLESSQRSVRNFYREFSKKKAITPSAEAKIETSIRILRTIQSDRVVTHALANELKKNLLRAEKAGYVVLISEWDTYFGRQLPRVFKENYCSGDCNHILQYSYQRGIDGMVPGASTSAPATKGTKGNGLAPNFDAIPMRPPTGTGQFDYLRRLATDIRQRDRELRLASGQGIRAVVLLGSDVFDKLLIMRALRPELPGAIFATTDLDAHLLHPAEYSWTRGVVVASSYEFQLARALRMSTMPFRDSYQTSVYLATRLAMQPQLLSDAQSNCAALEQAQLAKCNTISSSDAQSSCKLAIQTHYACDDIQQLIYDKIPTQLYEVGRQRLVPLSNGPHWVPPWNKVETPSFATAIAIGLLAMALLGIFAIHQMHPMSGRAVMVLTFSFVLFSALAVAIVLQGAEGEPLTFVAGASIWPAEYIRLTAVIFSVVFMWSVMYRLRKNWCELGARYFWGGCEEKTEEYTIREMLQSIAQAMCHPWDKLKKLESIYFLPVVVIAVIMLIMILVLPRTWSLMSKLWVLIGIWTTLISLWWFILYRVLQPGNRFKSINQWVASHRCEEKQEAVSMWFGYGEYGKGIQRYLRAIAYLIIYFGFASLLFTILGAPSSPCRGALACGLDKAIVGVSVMAMLLLLFLVVDAARLCICWVDSFSALHLDWSNSRRSHYVQQLRLPPNHAEVWMKVHLIGERTAEVTRLIYYPVMIILLLLLARSTYFDNWDFPQALAIVIGLNFIIALSSVVRLNMVARNVRANILKTLEEEKLATETEKKTTYLPTVEERQELIQQLQALQLGAYLRIWDQPPVRATMLLLGGVALTYAEYLSVLIF